MIWFYLGRMSTALWSMGSWVGWLPILNPEIGDFGNETAPTGKGKKKQNRWEKRKKTGKKNQNKEERGGPPRKAVGPEPNLHSWWDHAWRMTGPMGNRVMRGGFTN